MKSQQVRLFEFNECSWIPSRLREYATDFLSSLWCFDGFGTAKPAITPAMELMEKSINKTKTKKIVDMACGSGKASYQILLHLKQKGVRNLKLVLSDLYPNIEILKKLSDQNKDVSYEEESVDAMHCELDGFRTFFASFHHFNEQQATKIIKDAVARQEGIGIFEMTYRGFWNLFLLIGLAPLWVVLLTPVIRPVKIPRLIFTYVIPVIPLMLWWDGLVSVIRTYTEKELMRIIKKADPDDTFEWHTIKAIYGLPKVFAMVGYPRHAKAIYLREKYFSRTEEPAVQKESGVNLPEKEYKPVKQD